MDEGSYDVDVLVVGAGPTGLTMASELARRGVRCRVVDQAPVRSPRSRALVVQARTLELFQKMGVADAVIAEGQRGIRIGGFMNGRRFAAVQIDDIGVDDTPYPFLLFVSQAETERVLDAHLAAAGLAVERPLALVDLAQDDTGVTATLRRAGDTAGAAPGGGESVRVRARYVVGCDGAHSAVRKLAKLSFEGAPYPQSFLLADLEVEWSEGRDQVLFFLGDAGLMVLFPLKGRALWRIIASPAAEAPADAGDPTLADFEALARVLVPVPLRLHDPKWLARFRLHHRGVDRYRAGRLFVAGDAAHIHSPAGGQGMNTGIQDAYNLAWKLALVVHGRAPDALLDSYHAERHPVGRRLLEFTDRMFSAATSRNRLLTLARTLLVPRVAPVVLGQRALRRRVFRFVSQLGIRYRGSPIVTESRAGADGPLDPALGPLPGCRAPDAPVRALATASDSTLFDAMTGPEHQLLLFAGSQVGGPAWAAQCAAVEALRARWGGLVRAHWVVARAPGADEGPADALLDAQGLAAQRYGVRDRAAYLVRPDGYVAFRVSGLDVAAVDAYLRDVLSLASP